VVDEDKVVRLGECCVFLLKIAESLLQFVIEVVFELVDVLDSLAAGLDDRGLGWSMLARGAARHGGLRSVDGWSSEVVVVLGSRSDERITAWNPGACAVSTRQVELSGVGLEHKALCAYPGFDLGLRLVGSILSRGTLPVRLDGPLRGSSF